jgi:hypothetical protein
MVRNDNKLAGFAHAGSIDALSPRADVGSQDRCGLSALGARVELQRGSFLHKRERRSGLCAIFIATENSG